MFHRRHRSRQVFLGTGILCTVSVVVAASWEVRTRRARLIKDLPDVSELGRSARSLIDVSVRSSLMGSRRNVSDEVDYIRKWHRERGYNGGIVLREVNTPLYIPSDVEIDDLGEEVINPVEFTKDHDSRHCYYMYYEVHSDGRIRQQIFCRGTTLHEDIYTDLKVVYVYDEELGCRLHLGFKQHADRMLEDLYPLLAHQNPRATVELAGHSLGGAVALIVAMKLRKRGHRVVRVTTFGSPRPCDSSSVSTLSPLLPPDTLRIESDYDIVPLFPLRGKPLGNKLWFINDSEGSIKFVPSYLAQKEASWVDSFMFNFRIPELLFNASTAHRMRHYKSKLELLDIELSSKYSGSKDSTNCYNDM